MKLEKIVTIKGTLRCMSGLHIGGGDTEMHIGGIDNAVIRHPLTQRPYIPGSSLKGKMRSLLEWRSGAVKAAPLGWSDYQNAANPEAVMPILKLFGAGGNDKLTLEEVQHVGPTRLSFWDCDMSDDWAAQLDEDNQLATEAKSENSINRITGKAANPRYTERVVVGTPFNFRLSVKVLDVDTDELMKTVLAGLRLMELDSIGGSGSRGYGKIAFENLTIDGEDYQAKFEAIDPFKMA